MCTGVDGQPQNRCADPFVPVPDAEMRKVSGRLETCLPARHRVDHFSRNRKHPVRFAPDALRYPLHPKHRETTRSGYWRDRPRCQQLETTGSKLPGSAVDQVQQFPDRAMRFHGMPERLLRSNPVLVLAADLFAVDDSAGLQIGDDPLHGPFGDSDLQRHLAQHHRRVARQEHQDVPMICQKRPLRTIRRRRCRNWKHFGLRTRCGLRRNRRRSAARTLAGSSPPFFANRFHGIDSIAHRRTPRKQPASQVYPENAIEKYRISIHE